MDAPGFDPFEVLGLARGASPTQIRAAYRALVGRYHPDKHRGNPLEALAAEKLTEVNRAYEILSDDVLRAGYERHQAKSVSPPRAAPSSARAVVVPGPGMKLLRSLGLLLAVGLLLRFGLGLGAEVFALVRALLLGVVSLFRLGPVPAIVAIIVMGAAASFFFRLRKNRG
ncbi:MAG TPA: J domain-containing protein [Polyangiaceae bacterium]|nr:J domain-containing protein [Polyangiaceae bacterium]